MHRDQSVWLYIVCILCTFNLPPPPPPHCLDNGPNNQHNCREKFFFFFLIFLFLKVLAAEAGRPWLPCTFHQVPGSRQSSLCCQTLPLSNLAGKERQKVLFKIHIESLQRERKRGADWFLRDFFPPVCYPVHLHLIYFWP